MTKKRRETNVMATAQARAMVARGTRRRCCRRRMATKIASAGRLRKYKAKLAKRAE
jgi:hypothetical protein